MTSLSPEGFYNQEIRFLKLADSGFFDTKAHFAAKVTAAYYGLRNFDP